MSNEKRATKLRRVPLPVVTFADLAAFGLEVHVWCPRCHTMRRATIPAEKLRTRFAGAAFRCHCGAPGYPSFRQARTGPKDRATRSWICTARIACPRGKCGTFGLISGHGLA
jgi:hypothetical protein